MRTKGLFLFILMSAAFLPLWGCGLLAGGTGSNNPVTYIKGELNTKFDSDLNTVWIATQKVVDESKFEVKSKRADAFSAVVKAEDAQQRKIEITLEKIEPSVTSVRIRVGLLGEVELSNRILDEIKKKVS